LEVIIKRGLFQQKFIKNHFIYNLKQQNMTFVIITHVPHVIENNLFYAYAPYVREMNIWIRRLDKIIIVAPIASFGKSAIDIMYEHDNIEFVAIDSFDIMSIKSSLRSFLKTPLISGKIVKAMREADHIHLRCPGNIGLLGCFVQMFFPNIPKTAKYAGNWDPKAKQPWTYNLQQWILSNTFLTRNMQVLVYGDWKNSNSNIKSFFTASYKEEDKLPISNKVVKGCIDFIFVGALVKGKNPLYAIQLVEFLGKRRYDVRLRLYGEGIERAILEQYIIANQLETVIELQGNQSKDIVQKAYQNSHFVVLPSDSEGWPKAIAEGMFWGCVPLATPVSCLPFMLDEGKRGLLLDMDLEKDAKKTEILLNDQADFNAKSQNASNWSRNYTLDVFEREIIAILKQNLKFNK
jgi:glycosyltransferase involved in cell wall biosynthesis